MTEKEKEIFKDIKIDKIDEVVSSVNKNTNINKNESVIKKCSYTKVSYENKSGDDRFKTAINVSKSSCITSWVIFTFSVLYLPKTMAK
jgi:hypothetical protein